MLISYIGLREMGITYSPKYIRSLARIGRFPKPASGGRSRDPFRWEYDDIANWIQYGPLFVPQSSVPSSATVH